MTRKIKYTAEPVGPVRIVADFLPSPDQLAFKEDSQKVTIGLSRRSIAFFAKGDSHSGHRLEQQKRRPAKHPQATLPLAPGQRKVLKRKALWGSILT